MPRPPGLAARVRPLLLLALGATAVMVYLYGAIDPVEHYGSGIMYYWPMADAAPGLDVGQPQPYVYRWLGPWLAGVLPGPSAGGFYALSALGSLVLAGVMWAVLRADGRSEQAAGLTVALLAMNPYLFGFNVFNHFHLSDLLVQIGLGVALLLLWRQRYVAMGLVLALAVLAREPPVLFIPVAFVYLWERGRLREDGPRAALALVPLLCLFIGPRLLLVPEGGPSLVQTFINASGKAASPETWYRLVINATAPLTPLLVIFGAASAQWARARWHLVVFYVLVLGSCFFGGDQERLMQPALIALYPVLALVVERHVRGVGPRAFLVAAAFVTSLHHLTARFPLPSRPLTIVLSLAALAAVTALGLYVRARDRSPGVGVRAAL